MPTLLSDADVGLSAGPAPKSGLMSDADVGLSAAPTAAAPAASGTPGQLSIPLPGGRSLTPSIIGMIKGLYQQGKDAATLGGDVMQGRVDPTSDEGIARAVGMASMFSPLSRVPAAAVKSVAAPGITELKTAATPTYQELTKLGNATPKDFDPMGITQSITDTLHPQALRAENAPRTHGELGAINRAQDINDVAIARDKLRDIKNGISENRLIRVAPNDARAAGQAMEILDQQLEKMTPGWTQKMAEADANWAAAKRMEKVQKEADKGAKGRLGSFDTNETRAKGFTPEEIDAVKRAHQGGMLGTGLNALGALSPFHGGITGAVSAAMHVPAAVSSGGMSLAGIPVGMAADAAARMLRQRALNQALTQIASRSPLAAQRGVGSIVAGRSLSPPVPMGLLPFLPDQQQK